MTGRRALPPVQRRSRRIYPLAKLTIAEQNVPPRTPPCPGPRQGLVTYAERHVRARLRARRSWSAGTYPRRELYYRSSNEVGALLVAAGLGPAGEHALVSLPALNGLRVSEAIGADIEALGVERGHRTLTVLRKGGKTVTIRLAPRTARAVDLAVDERSAGPIFATADGGRLDLTAPPASSAGSPAGPGSPS